VYPPQTLEVNNITLSRGGKKLLRDISFVLTPGHWIHVQGDNGIGKTTLLRAVTSLVPLDSGEVSWGKKNTLDDRPSFLKDVFFMGHKLALKEELSPFENLNIETQLMQAESTSADILSALDYFGLRGREQVPLAILSQGQKRRVSLAKLKLTHAPLWVLDEPFVALDTHSVGLLTGLIEDHLVQGGSVILTSHQNVDFECPGEIMRLSR